MIAQVGAFNWEKVLVGAFYVIVKSSRFFVSSSIGDTKVAAPMFW